MAYMSSSHKADGTPVQVDLGRGTVLKGSVSKMPFCPNGCCSFARNLFSYLPPDIPIQILSHPGLRCAPSAFLFFLQ